MQWIRFFIVMLAVLTVAAVQAQAGALQVSETDIDYGTIQEGPPVVKKVVLTNTGSETLVIANITAN